MRLGWLLFLALTVSCLVSAVFSGPALAKRPDFSMVVSPKEATLDDTITLTVKIDLPGLTGPDRYWHPDTSQFKIVDSQIKRGTESSLDPSLGQKLHTVEIYRYILKPLDTGRLLIGPAKIRIGADDWETRQLGIRIRVGTGRSNTTAGIGDTDERGLSAPGYLPPTGPRPDVFLYAVSDKKRAWVGEQITVSWLLFARAEVLKYEPTPPRLAGLWTETLFEPTSFFQYSDARIGDKDYVVALVSKRAFFASEGGDLKIGGLKAKIATVSTALGRTETIESNALAVTIEALPQPAPPGFDPSYVGHFEIASTVDRDLVGAGESLTLSVRVRGKSAMARTTPPRLRFPGFVFEQPRDSETTSNNEGDLVAGERVYRYWTTPSKGGKQTIPAIELPYFDPKLGRYQIAKSVAIGVTIEGDPSVSDAATAKRTAAQALGRDIRLLRTPRSVESRVLVGVHERWWFWVMLGFPPLAFLGVFQGDRFLRRQRGETPRARLRRARGKARAHLKLAEIHLRGLRSAKFYAALSHAIYGHLEEWLDQNVQSLTQGQLKALLKKRGLDAPLVRRIHDTLESFDRSRFAPSGDDNKEMRSAVLRTKELLSRVESVDIASVETELAS